MKHFNLKTKSVKSLFLLLAMFVAGTSPTWADELTIFGSSTQTRNDLPIYGYNADTSGDQCEFVVPASLLSSMNGNNITGLKFYTANFSWGTNIPEYKVYMKEVTSATLSAFSGETGATTVYTGTFSLADGVMTVTFSEPYEYNGGNLLIGTKVSKTGSYRPKDSSTFYGDTSSDVQCGKSSAGNSYFIPRTTFVYESASVSGPALAVKDGSTKLTSPYAYNFGLATAGTTKTFTLKNPGDANVALSVDATTGYAAELSSSTLAAGGEVTLTITMNATGDGIVTISSTTEGIDDFVINVSGTVRDPNKMWCNFAGGLPTGWTNSGSYTITTSGAGDGTSGGGYAGETAYSYKLMYTPLVTITDGEKLYLKVAGYGSTASWNEMQIRYSSDGANWTTAKTVSNIVKGSWTSVEVTEIPSGAWYIGFYGRYVYFTDIYGGTESTAPVIALSQSSYDFGLIDSNTTSSAITITNTGKSALTGMNLVSNNAAFTFAVADNATTIAANGGTATFTVTMSSANQGVQNGTITVKSDNADDLVLNVSGAVAKAGTTTIDFNDNSLPSGWSKTGNTSFSDGAAYFYYSYTNTLTSPKLIFVAGDFLVVKAKMASEYGYVTVKGSTDGTTFTEIKKLDSSLLNQSDYTTCIISDITTTVKYIQLDGYYCYVDEIAGLTYAPVLSVTKGGEAVTTPAAHAFGEVSADQTVTFNFTNTGAGTINITNVVSDNDVFTTNWTATVAASNYDLVITANYDATKAGEQNGAITVTTTEGEFVINLTSTFLAANAPQMAVYLSGVAVINDETVDFGKVTADAVKTITVKNNGTGSMAVNIYSNSEDFTVSPASLTGIGAGESKTFDITFKYGSPYGVKNGEILIQPTYDTNAAININVTGKAKDPNVWSEDFSGNTLPTGWESDGSSYWTFSDGIAQGVYNSTYNMTKALTTPVLTVSGETDELTFSYKRNNAKMYIKKSKDGAAFVDLYKDSSFGTDSEWQTYTITGLEAGNYKFQFMNEDYKLDNFEGFVLKAAAAHEAEVKTQTIPASGNQYVEYTASIDVKVTGTNDEQLNVKFFIGDTQYGENVVKNVASNATETFEVAFTPATAVSGDAYFTIESDDIAAFESDKVAVTIAAATVLDEATAPTLAEGTLPSVVVKYTAKDGWNTICMPFALTSDILNSIFGTGWKAYEFKSYNGTELGFSTTTTFYAGYPYIIYVETAATHTDGVILQNISIDRTTAQYDLYSGAYFRGTYAPVADGAWTKNADTDIIYGVTSAGKIAKAGSGASIKGFRAYFDLPAGSSAPSISFEDTTTGIGSIDNGQWTMDNSEVYNMNGQKVQNAQKGLYIVNGKKVVVK